MPVETYTSKPTTKWSGIGKKEAIQWDPDQPEPVLAWLDEHGVHYKVFPGGELGVGTLESGEDLDRHTGGKGWWVLRGLRGEFYLCADDVFRKSYEPDSGQWPDGSSTVVTR